MLGEDGVILPPAHYGLTLHRGVGRLLGLGVLRAARGLPDWINAEASKASGCTLNQWEEETTGAGQTKKKTFQIEHSTRNTETDTLKRGNEQRMKRRREWLQRAIQIRWENKQERMYIWLRRSTDGRHMEEGKQARLRADTRPGKRQALPLRSSSSIVVLALSVDSWRNVKEYLWITFRLDTGQCLIWCRYFWSTSANKNASYYLVSVHWVVDHGSLWLLK